MKKKKKAQTNLWFMFDFTSQASKRKQGYVYLI